jgi:hypothetical protein
MLFCTKRHSNNFGWSPTADTTIRVDSNEQNDWWTWFLFAFVQFISCSSSAALSCECFEPVVSCTLRFNICCCNMMPHGSRYTTSAEKGQLLVSANLLHAVKATELQVNVTMLLVLICWLQATRDIAGNWSYFNTTAVQIIPDWCRHLYSSCGSAKYR